MPLGGVGGGGGGVVCACVIGLGYGGTVVVGGVVFSCGTCACRVGMWWYCGGGYGLILWCAACFRGKAGLFPHLPFGCRGD